MNVGQLIEELKKHPKSTRVVFNDEGCGCCGGFTVEVERLKPGDEDVDLGGFEQNRVGTGVNWVQDLAPVLWLEGKER